MFSKCYGVSKNINQAKDMMQQIETKSYVRLENLTHLSLGVKTK